MTNEDFDEFIGEHVQNPEVINTIHQILQEMYEEAEPGMDYRQALEDGEREDGFPRYRLHYLDADRQDEIVEKHVEGMKDRHAGKVSISVHLGAAPTTVKEAVNKKRREAGLDPIGEE